MLLDYSFGMFVVNPTLSRLFQGMDNGAIFDRIVQSLAFEVEAVPKDNVIKLSSGANTTPVNVKVRLRKKDHHTVPNQGIAVIPKYDEPHASSRLRLASSDQTIISFNMLLEADLEKMIHSPKPRKRFLNGLISSVCLGTKSDDDNFPYLPSSNKNFDSGSGARSTIPINIQKQQEINKPHGKKHNKLFGKCKPGGCLDPPFGEDKYIYKPTKKKVPHKSTYELQSGLQIENVKTEDGLPLETKKKQHETSPVVSLYEAMPKTKTSNTSHSFSLITYPPDGDDSTKQFATKAYESEKIPNDKNHTRQESADSYFLPPIRKDSKQKNFLPQHYFEQNTNQKDKGNKNIQGESNREPPEKNVSVKRTHEQQSSTLNNVVENYSNIETHKEIAKSGLVSLDLNQENVDAIQKQKPTTSQFVSFNKKNKPYNASVTKTPSDLDFDKSGQEPFNSRMLNIEKQATSGPKVYVQTMPPSETEHYDHLGASFIPPSKTENYDHSGATSTLPISTDHQQKAKSQNFPEFNDETNHAKKNYDKIETEYFDNFETPPIPPSYNLKDREQIPEDVSNLIGNKPETSLYQDTGSKNKHEMLLPANLNQELHARQKSQNFTDNNDAVSYDADDKRRTPSITTKKEKLSDILSREKDQSSREVIHFQPDHKHHKPVDPFTPNYSQTNEELAAPFNNVRDVNQLLKNDKIGQIDSSKGEEHKISPATYAYDSQKYGLDKVDFEPPFMNKEERKSITKTAPIKKIEDNFGTDDKNFNVVTDDILTSNKTLKPAPLATLKTIELGPSFEHKSETVEKQQDDMGEPLKYNEQGEEDNEKAEKGMKSTENDSEFSELQKQKRVRTDPKESIKKKVLLPQNQDHSTDKDPSRSGELLLPHEQNDFYVSPIDRSQYQYEQIVERPQHDAVHFDKLDNQNISDKQFAIDSNKFDGPTLDFDEITGTRKRGDISDTENKEEKIDFYNVASTHDDNLSAQGFDSKIETQNKKRIEWNQDIEQYNITRQELTNEISDYETNIEKDKQNGIEVDMTNLSRLDQADANNYTEQDNMFDHPRSDMIRDKQIEGQIKDDISKKDKDNVFHIQKENEQNSESLRSVALIQDPQDIDFQGQTKINIKDLSQSKQSNDLLLTHKLRGTQLESDLNNFNQSKREYPFDDNHEQLQINQESGEIHNDKLVSDFGHIETKQKKQNIGGTDYVRTSKSNDIDTKTKPYKLPDDILFDKQSERTIPTKNHISPKSSLVSILKSGSNGNSITLDLAFQLSKPDNKSTVIKSLSRNQADKYPDNALVINGTTSYNDVVTVPIGPNREMNIKIVRSKNKHESRHRDINQMSPDKISGHSNYMQEMSLDADYKNNTIYESRIWNAQIVRDPGSQDSMTLTRIYEEQLVPLKVVIANFKIQIDSLVNQQLLIRRRLLEVRRVQRRKEKKVCGCINRPCL